MNQPKFKIGDKVGYQDHLTTGIRPFIIRGMKMKITDEMIEKMFIKSVEKTHDVDFDGTFLNYKDYWKKEYALFKAAISLLLPIIEKQAEAVEFCANSGNDEYSTLRASQQTQKEVIEMLNKITEATK